MLNELILFLIFQNLPFICLITYIFTKINLLTLDQKPDPYSHRFWKLRHQSSSHFQYCNERLKTSMISKMYCVIRIILLTDYPVFCWFNCSRKAILMYHLFLRYFKQRNAEDLPKGIYKTWLFQTKWG